MVVNSTSMVSTLVSNLTKSISTTLNLRPILAMGSCVVAVNSSESVTASSRDSNPVRMEAQSTSQSSSILAKRRSATSLTVSSSTMSPSWEEPS